MCSPDQKEFCIRRIAYRYSCVALVKEVFSDMRRYYFHVKRGQMLILDHEGLELPDSNAAAQVAKRRGREIASAEAQSGVAPTAISIVIADEHWLPLWEVPLDDSGTS
jgi:hypothetical protein